MSVKDGWEPLCKFLNKPVPDAPFPRANESAAVARIMPRAVMKVFAMWLALGAGITSVAWAGWMLVVKSTVTVF